MSLHALGAWLVHLYTASGVAFALLAALEVCKPAPDPRMVFVWLAIAVLIDATDGPLARRFEVKRVLPQIDGRKIDDIVDYLTFTFVPLLLVARMGWVPQPALAFVVPAMMASLLGFANAGAKDESDGFFLGFPSYWNIVAFYLGLSPWKWANGAIVLALAALTVMPVGFIYPNLAPRRWKAAILVGAYVWLGVLAAMLVRYPATPIGLTVVSLVYPLFYVVVSLIEYRHRSTWLASLGRRFNPVPEVVCQFGEVGSSLRGDAFIRPGRCFKHVREMLQRCPGGASTMSARGFNHVGEAIEPRRGGSSTMSGRPFNCVPEVVQRCPGGGSTVSGRCFNHVRALT